MGNDALYRWAYAAQHSLVVSDWRSIDKEIAEAILQDIYPSSSFKVTQGYPVLENIAVYFLNTELNIEDWLAKRQSRWDPFPIVNRATTVVDKTVGLFNDILTTLCNIFWGKMQQSLILGKVSLMGLLTSFVLISPLSCLDLTCVMQGMTGR